MKATVRWALLLGFAVIIVDAWGVNVSVAPSADSSMRSTDPDHNFGDSNPLLVGNSKEPFVVHNRALIQFDLRSIPTNAIITNVFLSVSLFRANTDPANFELHRMLTPWSEYDCSWNQRMAGVPWSEGGARAGVDYFEQSSGTAQIESGFFAAFGMVADVQAWTTNPATNFGWIISPATEEPGTGKQIGSRESDYSPLLVIDYTTNAPPMPPRILGTGLAGGGIRFSFRAEAQHDYRVESRDDFEAGEWRTLTNIFRTNQGIVNFTNAISSTLRSFRIIAQ